MELQIKLVTLSASPFDWLEASFFIPMLQIDLIVMILPGEFCLQDFKDKGFNIKERLKKQGVFPAIAIGLNDLLVLVFIAQNILLVVME